MFKSYWMFDRIHQWNQLIWDFIYGDIFHYCFNFLTSNLSIQIIYLFMSQSQKTVMSLGIEQFLLGYPVCWHMSHTPLHIMYGCFGTEQERWPIVIETGLQSLKYLSFLSSQEFCNPWYNHKPGKKKSFERYLENFEMCPLCLAHLIDYWFQSEKS